MRCKFAKVRGVKEVDTNETPGVTSCLSEKRIILPPTFWSLLVEMAGTPGYLLTLENFGWLRAMGLL